MDVFECPKSLCWFSAFNEHGHTTHILMAHNEKLVQKSIGEDNKQAMKESPRDMFKVLPRRLLEDEESIRVGMAALA